MRKRSVFSVVYAPDRMPQSRRRRKIEFRKKSELRKKSEQRETSELWERVLLWANAVERSPVEDLWQKEEQEAIQREEAAQW